MWIVCIYSFWVDGMVTEFLDCAHCEKGSRRVMLPYPLAGQQDMVMYIQATVVLYPFRGQIGGVRTGLGEVLLWVRANLVAASVETVSS